MIKIETDVPIPKIIDKVASYPWDLMSVGNSFYIPKEEKSYKAIVSALRYANKKHASWKFICVDVGEGTRCWRVE